MNLEWSDLSVFLAAKRAGSLRKAASDLGVSHATALRSIERLESALDTRLFERSRSGVQLSAAGELLVPHAEEIERQAFEISRKVAGVDLKPSGVLRLSVPPALVDKIVAPALADFSRNYPNIELELQVTNNISDLTRHEADVSIRVAYEVDEDVVGRKLVQFTRAPYASPAYLKSIGPLEPGDGSGAVWLGWFATDDPNWVKSSPFPNAKLRHCFPDAAPQMEAAASGMGMTWMPCFLGDQHPGLVRVPGVAARPDRSIWLLLHKDLRNTARVRAFVDHMSRWFARSRDQFVPA